MLGVLVLSPGGGGGSITTTEVHTCRRPANQKRRRIFIQRGKLCFKSSIKGVNWAIKDILTKASFDTTFTPLYKACFSKSQHFTVELLRRKRRTPTISFWRMTLKILATTVANIPSNPNA